MTSARRRFLSVSVLLVGLLSSLASFAAGPAEDFVKAKHNELTQLIKQNASDAKLDKVFDETLDYEALAKGALAANAEGRTPEELAEFKKLLTQLVRTAYRKNLKKTLGYDVKFAGVEKAQNGDLVKTVATSRSNAREEPVSIDYVVSGSGATARVVDIVTEGSSLVSNYRSQFGRVIKKHGFQELLKRMRNKAAGGGDVG